MSEHKESPWVCPICGCPRSASKRLEQQKPTVTRTEIVKVHKFIVSGQWGLGMFLEWFEQKGMVRK